MSGLGGTAVRKVKGLGEPSAMCSAPRRKGDRGRLWPLGPAGILMAGMASVRVGGQEGGKLEGGRSQLKNGLITSPLDSILKSMGVI